ncbi:MAG TPA: HAD-IC family P-type ATPase, partial [Chloroflexota bacterium]|nr:HAD-IC family P-type ATPase [Chloroflexota bacterium]
MGSAAITSDGIPPTRDARSSDAMLPFRGLSEAEAAARRARGQGNDVRFYTSRSYLQILWQNAFTFINVLLVAVCSVLIWMRRLDDAVLTGGLVAMNVIVGLVQEGRAKRHLDHIALLTRPTAAVVREGRERVVDPGEVVLGGILVARPGDQIVVDGQVVDGRIDADESLLTGESDHVPKRVGDTVSSGTFCVTGSARYEACKVGAESLANTLTASARVYRQVKTPLQRDIAIVIRVLVLLASLIGLLLALSFVLRPIPPLEQVQIAAVLVSLVPQGLIALITITYALGMVRMLRKGTLVQQANAVESLSHVDVLCLDKTGTLTTNRLRFCALHPLGRPESDVKRMLGDYAASVSERNRTAETIHGACGGQTRRLVEEVPFSSARKWGALACDDAALRGTYVLGAPEVLQPALQRDADLGTQGDTWAAQGLRVLLFAYRPDLTPLHDAGDGPTLPSELIPLGLVSLGDELRPDVQATLAAQAGLGTDLKVVSGLDLATLTDDELARMADEATIFGRIHDHARRAAVVPAVRAADTRSPHRTQRVDHGDRAVRAGADPVRQAA